MDEKFENVQKEMKGVPYKAGVGSLVNAMMTTMADIAFAMSTIQIKGRSTTLDGRETHCKVFKRYFGLHIMPQK